jgi:hypothetical protein
MKQFDSLTEQELVALSEDEVQRYIDYACAENGVPLLPSLPPAPVEVNCMPDVTVYSLGHWLHFATAEDASRALDAIVASKPIETTYISVPSRVTSTVIAKGKPNLAITSAEAFSADKAEGIKGQLAEAKRQEDVYAKAKKSYDAAVSEREAYASEIRDKVSAAWETHHRREGLRRDYERYLSLADGDTRIAARFLGSANRDAQALLPDLFIESVEYRERETPQAVGVADDIAF